MESQIIKTKISVPFSRTPLVHKQKLLGKLDKSKDLKLTILSAPPGAGKTTLLGEWARKSKVPVAYISLDKGDNDPARFCAYLATSMEHVNPKGKEAVLGMLNFLYTPPIEAVLTTLMNELADETKDRVMILDDYHEISNSEIHDGISFLVQHSPPQFHLIIGSRTAPPCLSAGFAFRGS